jgi:hypothetical protein
MGCGARLGAAARDEDPPERGSRKEDKWLTHSR